VFPSSPTSLLMKLCGVIIKGENIKGKVERREECLSVRERIKAGNRKVEEV